MRNVIAATVRLLRPFFPSGALCGMGFFLALFAVDLACGAGFSVMGVQQSEVGRLVVTSFWPYVLLSQLKILSVFLLIGFAAGWSAELVAVNLASGLPGIRIAWIACLHLWFVVTGLRKYPQLYTEAFYDRGGLLRRFQVFATDALPSWVIAAWIAALLLILAAAAARALSRAGRRRRIAAGVAAAGLVLARGMALLPHTAAAGTGTNIVILAADSLRKDRLGVEGYRRALTPAMDRLAAEGAYFEKQYTSLPRTFPAMISLVTGQLPLTHGVRHMFPSSTERNHEAQSIVRMLRDRGYHTAVISDFAGDVFSRFSAGFETVKVPYFNFITLIDQRSLEIHYSLLPYISNPAGRKMFPELKEFAGNADPALLTRETVATLDRLIDGGKPFFSLTFYSPIHFPYAAPDPWYRKYAVPGYSGRFKYHKPPTLYGAERLTGRDIEQIRGLYDGGVAAFDHAVGEVVDHLRKRGVLERTIVIVTADHGENLYEYDWHVGHGEHLRGNNVLNVPLIIRFPGGTVAPRRVAAVTRDIDIVPTLLDFLGLPAGGGKDGVSLMPLLRGERADLGLTAFSETGVWFSDATEAFYQKERILYPDITSLSKIDYAYNLEVVLKDDYRGLVVTAKHRMVDDGRYRLIYVPTRDGVRYELYDALVDPAFSKNIAAAMPEKTAEMKALLARYMNRDPRMTWINGMAVND